MAAVRRPLFLAGILLLAAFLAGCANGTYPVDLFYEMHYQQSYKVHEPPRVSVPTGAVPITGRQITTAENPVPGQGIEEGARLFAANCAFCHGVTGNGKDPVLQGPVLRIMREGYGYGTDARPYTITPDLTSQEVVDLPDVTIFGWITNGVTVMPSFDKLLTVEERWMLVNYIRTLQP
jgi:mono/diheme cytochrome c family protein